MNGRVQRLGELENLAADQAVWNEAQRIGAVHGLDPAEIIAEARRLTAAFGSNREVLERGVADERGVDFVDLRRDVDLLQ